jgi:hypothetical protein
VTDELRDDVLVLAESVAALARSVAAIAEAVRALPAPVVNVEVPAGPAPVVTLTTPPEQVVHIASLPPLRARVKRDRQGRVESIEE